MVDLKKAFLNPREAKEALGVSADITRAMTSPSPESIMNAGMSLARNASNEFVQDEVISTVKKVPTQVLDTVKSTTKNLPVPGKETAGSSVAKIENTIPLGVDKMAGLLKSMGLDKAIALAAKGLEGITMDAKKYADGIPGAESTLSKAPKELQEMASKLASAVGLKI